MRIRSCGYITQKEIKMENEKTKAFVYKTDEGYVLETNRKYVFETFNKMIEFIDSIPMNQLKT